VVFIRPNPDAGKREELKIGYVLPVGDTGWVGSDPRVWVVEEDREFFTIFSLSGVGKEA
jgi:hypothetical protein